MSPLEGFGDPQICINQEAAFDNSFRAGPSPKCIIGGNLKMTVS